MSKNLAIVGASYLQLPLIEKAKEDGKTYLEITAMANNGWLGVDLLPNGATKTTGSSSTFDGKVTSIVDLSNVTDDDGFIRTAWVNEFALLVYHAEFIDKPVTDKVNYAHLNTKESMGYISGTWASVNDYKSDLAPYFNVDSQLWKTMPVAKATSFSMKKSLISQAIASGYTKLEIQLVAIQGATNAYHYSNLASSAIVKGASGVKSTAFTSGRATVTLDITNIANVSGDWAYLLGTDTGVLVMESAFFKK